jgi:hypothetical protein
VPKIRGIKPEFWTDEDVMELSIPARLLFIGLWNLACDNGHVPDRVNQIKMRLMPMDDVDADALLDELVDQGRIVRDDGTITIRKFALHQKPHRKWWTCCELPSCKLPEDAPSQGHSPRKSASQPGDNGGATVAQPRTTDDVDVDCDVDSEGDGELTRAKRAHRLPDTWQPSSEHVDRAATEGLDLRREVEKFKAYNESRDRKLKNWNSAFTQWLIQAVEFATPRRQPSKPVSTLRNVNEIPQPPDGLTPEQYGEWHRQNMGAR